MPQENFAFLHFDSIGVPSLEEMIEQYGSGTEWQKQMTHLWVKKILAEYSDKKIVIIEGQTNLSFILSAFEKEQISNYTILLFHCDNTVRHKRLRIDRNQAELVNEEMDNWSRFLKKQAVDLGIPIIDTTMLDYDEITTIFKDKFNKFII